MNDRLAGPRQWLHNVSRGWPNRIRRGVLLAGSFAVSVTLVVASGLDGPDSMSLNAPVVSIAASGT